MHVTHHDMHMPVLERVSSREASELETPTEAKNAEVIGAIAILLVAFEIAFMVLLDFNHLQRACAMFKTRNCRKRKTRRVYNVAPAHTPVLLHVPGAYTSGEQALTVHTPSPHSLRRTSHSARPRQSLEGDEGAMAAV